MQEFARLEYTEFPNLKENLRKSLSKVIQVFYLVDPLVVGNYYLAEKIKVMRKQKALSTIPDDFKEKYEGILKL